MRTNTAPLPSLVASTSRSVSYPPGEVRHLIYSTKGQSPDKEHQLSIGRAVSASGAEYTVKVFFGEQIKGDAYSANVFTTTFQMHFIRHGEETRGDDFVLYLTLRTTQNANAES